MSPREEYLLKQILDFDINRYLMANSCQRLDGGEKAERHINMSKAIVGFITCDKRKEHDPVLYMPIHDYLAEHLTDKMDEVISFPVLTPLYGDMYKPLVDKFFHFIVENMDEMENLIIE